MEPSFTPLEIFSFAISLEEEGVKFYEKFAKIAKGETKELFLKLADDERQHAAYFTKLYKDAQAENETFDYLFDEHVNDFFHAYAKSTGFNRDEQEITTVLEAIVEGIRTEQITIDYYKNLLTFATDATKDALLRLIREEEDHLERLQKLL